MSDPIQARSWRKTKQAIKGRTYWGLQCGFDRSQERTSLALGYVSETQAEAALARVKALEAEGLGLRLTDLYAGRAHELVATGATSPEEAKLWAKGYLLGEVPKERLWPPQPAGGPSAPVDPRRATVAQYLEQVYAGHRAASKPKTWRTEEGDWRRLIPLIGDLKVETLDEFAVDEALRGLQRLKGGASSWNQKRKLRNAIAGMLNHAYRRRHRTKPCPTWFDLEGSAPTGKASEKALSRDQLGALLEHCGDQLRAIVLIGIGLGLRPNEILALSWEDINLKSGTASIRGTKTEGSSATVPLLPIAKVALEDWAKVAPLPPNGPIFKQTDGSAYKVEVGHVAFRKALSTAARKAGLPWVTPYTLRHTAATWLVEAGLPSATVAKVLRHTNPRMLEKHYDHCGATRAPGLHLAPTL